MLVEICNGSAFAVSNHCAILSVPWQRNLDYTIQKLEDPFMPLLFVHQYSSPRPTWPSKSFARLLPWVGSVTRLNFRCLYKGVRPPGGSWPCSTFRAVQEIKIEKSSMKEISQDLICKLVLICA